MISCPAKQQLYFWECSIFPIRTIIPQRSFVLSLEREQLKQRQREGIEIAKAQGKYTGRKPIPTDWTRFGQLYGEWRAKHITGRDFMRRMDMSANTFYRRVREYELRHGIAEPTSAWPFGERNSTTAPSEPAERKTNRWKEKALRNACRVFPRACGYSVPIGFVPVVVCSTILIIACVEQKSGAPIGYGFWRYLHTNVKVILLHLK